MRDGSRMKSTADVRRYAKMLTYYAKIGGQNPLGVEVCSAAVDILSACRKSLQSRRRFDGPARSVGCP